MKRQVTASPPAGRDPNETKTQRVSSRYTGVAGEMPRKVRAREALPGELRQLERLFADCGWPDRREFVQARKRARARALDVLEGSSSGVDSSRIALLVAAAELFVAFRMALPASVQEAACLVQQLEDIIGIPRIALAREVLRAPELLTMSPAVAVEAQLGALIALAPLRNVSLWTLRTAEHANCVRHVGDGSRSRGARQLAERLLAGEITEPTETTPRRLLLGLPVGRRPHPIAALVASARPGMRDSSRCFLADAAPILGAVLERDALLSGSAASERALVESSERKLTRLGFDLHDGPIQEVAILAEDLRLFRDQLEGVLASTPQRQVVRGRLEDLDAQLVALDSELRRISNEVHSASVLLNRPFSGALRDVARAFATRTNIEPGVTIEGDTGLLSVSQQIALLNVIHEALTNVRDHAEATAVRIVVSVNEQGVEAQVTDNGHGFDLEPTLMQSARRGHLGLVAMHERVRLLGGQCRIDSRPGGPTVISVALERWVPLAEPAQPTSA